MKSNSKAAFTITALCIFIVFLKHPAQFLHPQFWSEDSYLYFYSSVDQLFAGLSGYLCLVQRIIILLFTPLTKPEYHPTVCLIAAVSLFALLIYFFLKTPSRLPVFWVFAFGLVLSPHYGSEVHAKLLYLMWILPLAVFLILFRHTQKTSNTVIAIDMLWIVLAGLSGPIIIILLPPLLYVLAIKRNRYYLIMTITALICGVVQFIYLSQHPQSAISLQSSNPSIVLNTFFTFFTNFLPQYLYPGWVANYLIGMLCFALLALLVLSLDRSSKFEASILAILLFSTAIPPILKLYPSATELLNPVTSGSSRYFFYPFISITFYLLLILLKGTTWGKVASLFILIVSFANNLPGFQTTSFDGKWIDHMNRSQDEGCNARIPIPHSGKEGISWTYQSNVQAPTICSDHHILFKQGDRFGSVRDLSNDGIEVQSKRHMSIFKTQKIAISQKKIIYQFRLTH